MMHLRVQRLFAKFGYPQLREHPSPIEGGVTRILGAEPKALGFGHESRAQPVGSRHVTESSRILLGRTGVHKAIAHAIALSRPTRLKTGTAGSDRHRREGFPGRRDCWC